MKKIIFILITILIAGCQKEEEFSIDKTLSYCDRQIHRTLAELKQDEGEIEYTMVPRNIADSASSWHLRKTCVEEWCQGFWPGVLWYDYEATGDEEIRREADRFTTPLEFLSQRPAFDHDLGFLIFLSYGNGYRLTGDRKYKQVILDTANRLAELYNPKVGTILSWPRNVELFGGHNTIIDNMINLEMLFWAAKNGGDNRLYDIAVKHAATTMRHHFRPDYSCYHVAVYDTLSGEFIKGQTHQGYADNSLWARGQAWAIYGYTMVFRETRDSAFLDFAQKVTDCYLTRLKESVTDWVPYWDFDDPNIPNAPRDASAAACIASALLELSQYVAYPKNEEYLDAAKAMIESLSKSYQCGDSKPAFLNHSTGNYPAGSEIDYSIVYADYYYIEALIRLKKILTN